MSPYHGHTFTHKSFLGVLKVQPVYPFMYKDVEYLKFRNTAWLNMSYVPVGTDVHHMTDPRNQKDAIRWNSNSEDGEHHAVTLPGFHCDDLTKTNPATRWTVSKYSEKRTVSCYFTPVLRP